MKILPRPVPEHILENLLLFLCPLVNPTSLFMFFSKSLFSLSHFQTGQDTTPNLAAIPQGKNSPIFFSKSSTVCGDILKEYGEGFHMDGSMKKCITTETFPSSKSYMWWLSWPKKLKHSKHLCFKYRHLGHWRQMSMLASTKAREQGACEELTTHSH